MTDFCMGPHVALSFPACWGPLVYDHFFAPCRFLQCREEWLAELVADLDTSNAYDYLKRLTDAHRVQVNCFAY